MTTELFWLTATSLMIGVMWVPYVLNRIATRGLMRAVGNPRADDKPHSPWAERALLAHTNALESLVIFAALILVAHAAGVSNGITQGAAMIFFFARLAHYIVYTIGIPFARTLTFATGAFCYIAIALTLLGVL